MRPINPWSIVVGCIIVNLFSAAVFSIYAANIFFIDISKEFAWPVSTASLLVSVFFFSAGLGQLCLSSAITHYGIRGPAMAMAMIYGLTLAAIVFLPPSLPLFLTNFFIMGFTGGAAASPFPFSIAIAALIDRNRGLAFGLGAAGASLGAVVTPGISNFLIGEHGWRSALLIYSAVSTTFILLSMTFLLRTPEAVLRRNRRAGATAAPHSFRDLLDRVLLIIIGMLALNAICAVGILVNLLPLLREREVSTITAAAILSTAGISSWVGRVVVGWLLDRLFAPSVACGIFIAGAVGTLLLVYGGAGPLAFVGAVMVGVCMGAEADLAMYLVSRYVPLSAYSKAASMTWLAWAWGGALGTFIAAQAYNLVRDYEGALWIFVAMFTTAALLASMLPPYRVAVQTGRPRTALEQGAGA